MEAYKILFLITYFSNTLVGQDEFTLSDKREFYDSLQYKIGRLYFANGHLCSESVTDTVTKLSYTKHFSPDGRLDEEGNMDNIRGFHVGHWKYYRRNGKFKKVNFDSTSQTSYYKAVQIARSYGLNEPELLITEEPIKNKYYWKVVNWKYDGPCDPCLGKYILIRRSNGKVTKPKNNELSMWE